MNVKKLGKRFAGKARNQSMQNEMITLLSLEEAEITFTLFKRVRELEGMRIKDVWALFPGYLIAFEQECEILGDDFTEDKALQSFKRLFLSDEDDLELEYERFIGRMNNDE